MSDIRPSYDDEIDLFSLFETLWDAKWLISVVTFFFALMGLTFSLIAPKSYEVSTQIDHARFSVFVEYTPLNDILIDNGFYTSETNSGYLINSKSVFEMFLDEFNDYEEMVSVLQNDADVIQLLSDVQENDRNLEIFKLAKLFKIVPPAKPEGEWMASFEWRDVDQGKILFSAAIQKSLENVKQAILTDVSNLSLSLDEKNARELEQLQFQLSLVSGSASLKAERRLQYLREQSAIAKELEIETNQLGTNGLVQSVSNDVSLNVSDVSLNVSSSEVPFYLRGFKAIDKEIALVESRTDEQVLILEDEYIDVSDEIARIKSDAASSQLRNSLKLVESSNPSNWVDFNFLLAESKSKISSTLILALSVVLGGIISIFYVLVSSAIRARKVVRDSNDQSITA